MENEVITDDKLKELNDKKVEAFNLIRQISNFNNQLKNLNEQYGKLNQEIQTLEKEYVENNKKIE